MQPLGTDANFPASVRHRARDAVLATLPCQAAPVQAALSLMSGSWSGCLRTMIACSLDDRHPALCVGAALDLMHIGLQRLHVMLDSPDGVPALLGTGATVLAGDYLTSGAFKLLVHCTDMQVLRLVSSAITRTSELEADSIGTPLGDVASYAARAARLAPLGDAAGRAGAQLAGLSPALGDCAGRFGEQVLIVHALHKHADTTVDDHHAAALRSLAEQAAAQASREATALLAATGNGRPIALIEALLAHLRPAVTARAA